MTTEIDLNLALEGKTTLDLKQIIDGEKLIRLHPHWHINEITQAGDRISARLKDHATEEPFELIFDLEFPRDHAMKLKFQQGPVEYLSIFADGGGLKVAFSPNEGQLSADTQQTLTLWIQSIRQYIRLYLKSTPIRLLNRLLMNRVLLQMNPSQRKICLMLYRFTLLEILVIVLIVIGYFIFVQ